MSPSVRFDLVAPLEIHDEHVRHAAMPATEFGHERRQRTPWYAPCPNRLLVHHAVGRCAIAVGSDNNSQDRPPDRCVIPHVATGGTTRSDACRMRNSARLRGARTARPSRKSGAEAAASLPLRPAAQPLHPAPPRLAFQPPHLRAERRPRRPPLRRGRRGGLAEQRQQALGRVLPVALAGAEALRGDDDLPPPASPGAPRSAAAAPAPAPAGRASCARRSGAAPRSPAC